MEEHFVRLENEIPDIQFSLRMAGCNNFMGRKADGYFTDDRVLITKHAAARLKMVQAEVSQEGYVIAVYDTYRPVKAVKDFIRWSSDDSITNKDIFYPMLSKKEIFERGFIAEKSSHSRGSTIDLTLIEKNRSLLESPKLSIRKLKSGRSVPFYDDNSLDMGSSFDLFDLVSYPESKEISEEQYKRRKYLQNVMLKYGFESMEQEWWHFVLKNEPFTDTYFDFDIKK